MKMASRKRSSQVGNVDESGECPEFSVSLLNTEDSAEFSDLRLEFGQDSKTTETDTVTNSSITVKKKKIDKDGFLAPNTPKLGPKETENYASQDVDTRLGGDQTLDMRTDYRTLTTDQESPVETSYNEGTRGIPSLNQPLEKLVKEIGHQSEMMQLEWSKCLGNSEEYELFCPTRLDQILREAHTLEENLKQQKEKLRMRLQIISQTLQIP